VRTLGKKPFFIFFHEKSLTLNIPQSPLSNTGCT